MGKHAAITEQHASMLDQRRLSTVAFVTNLSVFLSSFIVAVLPRLTSRRVVCSSSQAGKLYQVVETNRSSNDASWKSNLVGK